MLLAKDRVKEQDWTHEGHSSLGQTYSMQLVWGSSCKLGKKFLPRTLLVKEREDGRIASALVLLYNCGHKFQDNPS